MGGWARAAKPTETQEPGDADRPPPEVAQVRRSIGRDESEAEEVIGRAVHQHVTGAVGCPATTVTCWRRGLANPKKIRVKEAGVSIAA